METIGLQISFGYVSTYFMAMLFQIGEFVEWQKYGDKGLIFVLIYIIFYMIKKNNDTINKILNKLGDKKLGDKDDE